LPSQNRSKQTITLHYSSQMVLYVFHLCALLGGLRFCIYDQLVNKRLSLLLRCDVSLQFVDCFSPLSETQRMNNFPCRKISFKFFSIFCVFSSVTVFLICNSCTVRRNTAWLKLYKVAFGEFSSPCFMRCCKWRWCTRLNHVKFILNSPDWSLWYTSRLG
jgi:hypothetical protein